MYMDNDNREKNEMSVMHDDLCKEKKEKAYQCYQKLRVQLTDELAEELDGVIFGGRLGEYKYYDMDAVVAAALDKAEECL